MQLNPKQRYIFIGKTNTGKTVFARYFDRAWVAGGWPVLIIDQDEKYVDEEKGQHYAKKPEESTVESPYNITDIGRLHPSAKVQIYHPSIPAWSDPKFLDLMAEVFQRGYICVHFDDLFGVADVQHTPLIIRKLWTSGRKKYIPIQALVQRPVGIAKEILNQSENFFIFLIKDPAERKFLAEFLGDPQVETEAPQYHHWEMLDGEHLARLVAPLPEHEVR